MVSKTEIRHQYQSFEKRSPDEYLRFLSRIGETLIEMPSYEADFQIFIEVEVYLKSLLKVLSRSHDYMMTNEIEDMFFDAIARSSALSYQLKSERSLDKKFFKDVMTLGRNLTRLSRLIS